VSLTTPSAFVEANQQATCKLFVSYVEQTLQCMIGCCGFLFMYFVSDRWSFCPRLAILQYAQALWFKDH